ncbi:hypothetical protein LTR85_006082 [Meristemomyces frigidus]|nr:hypothetical protein LTR85_006082 [Meristemomyces frigidus]
MLEHHWTRLQVAKWSVSLERSSPADLFYGLSSAVRQWHADHPGMAGHSLRVKHRGYSGGRSTTEISLASTRFVPMGLLFPPSFQSAPGQPESAYWVVTLDNVATEASAVTMYKTNDRSPYDRARATAGIKSYAETKEVLLFNTDDEILDGSISTPYFCRDGRWITPASASGGLQGTTRRWALENGLCVEETIKKPELVDGELMWLSNAARGYYRARYVARTSSARSDEPHT